MTPVFPKRRSADRGHVVAYNDGRKVIDVWDGLADPASGRQAAADTLYNVYSVTKAVAATALHIQAERGHVDYDAPIADYWPEFAANDKGKATVRHALTHRAGVPLMPEGVTPETMRSEEPTSELQSLMRNSSAVFCS